MKYGTLILLAIPLFVSGCTHTVQGVQQDTSQNAPIVQAAAQQASQSIVQAGKATDKTVSTDLVKIDHRAQLALIATRIKAQIIESKNLNNPSNLIQVDLSGSGITLRGHVINSESKTEADSIALSVIDKEHPGVPVSNQLSVKPG